MDKRISLGAIKLARQPNANSPVLQEVSAKDIAIIGAAAKLPDSTNLAEFWENIAAGKENLGEVPAGRKADIDAYLRFKEANTEELRFSKGAFLGEIDTFDHAFFNISPKEASLMNPEQRLLLETAWSAFEDAGYSPRKLTGTRTGVYIGLLNTPESYKYREMIQSFDPGVLPLAIGGNLAAITASRISYILNLRGPSLVVDTACSSSLVSLHLACQALRTGECDMAMAGGCNVILSPVYDEQQRIGIESSDGRTMTFDDTADGSGAGEGIVALLLKPLHKAVRDGDHIYAVIKGSATNQDGSSMGITVPNPEAQSDVLIAAWQDAGIDPETISYIETHGTGTRIGDPIEVEGLRGAFRRFTGKKQFCAVGSLKANLGHLNASSGLAGVMKVVLALQHRQLPPHIHFDRPNRQIDFTDSPVYVNTRLMPWEAGGHPLRGAISSFGLSGTNCHVVLEQAPAMGAAPRQGTAGIHALVLSARNPVALQELVSRYRRRLDSDPTLTLRDVCYTAGIGREHHGVRLAIVAGNIDDLRAKLSALDGADLKIVKHPWFSYGEHKVARPGGVRGSRETTQVQQESLTVRAEAQISQFGRTGKADTALLSDICSLYVAGAAIDWDALYLGETISKVSLPAYPFDRTRCWLEFPGFEPAEAPASTAIAPKGVSFFQRTWRREDLVRTGTAAVAGSVLVLAGAEDRSCRLAEALRGQGRDVIVANIGGDYARQDHQTWRLSGSEADYVHWLGDLRDREFSQIIHAIAWDERRDVAGLHTSAEHQDEGVLSLYRLVRAIAVTPPEAQVDILVLSTFADTVTATDPFTAPYHAALQGLAQAVRKDLPGVRCRSVDTDGETAVQSLLDELSWGISDLKVAYRQGIRHVPELGFTGPGESALQELTIRDDGVYLITGGLGGIGLALANYLVSKRSGVKLALVGRSGLPPREQWTSRAATDARIARVVAAIADLEVSSAEVNIFAADVADAGQMTAVIATLRLKYGRIAGIIHAAGIGKMTALMDQPEADFRALMSPKVVGTRVLDELTRQDCPDFFVMCSSVASVFPAPHQGAYAAANAFMDAYATYRSSSGLRTLAINWTTWKETGMATEYGLFADTMFKNMTTALALQGFASAVKRPVHRVLIGELNLTTGGAALMMGSGVRLSAELEGVLTKVVSSRAHQRVPRTAAGSGGAARLVGRDRVEYTATEQVVADICREKLGYSQIDVNENFFEMGADSIVLTAIAHRLQEQYPGKVAVTTLFQHATVAKLAQYLVEAAQGPVAVVREARAVKQNDVSGDIAIIGIAVKFPNADSTEEFWENLIAGVSVVSRFPEERRKDTDRYLEFQGLSLDQIDYLDGAYLSDISAFDYQYFRLPPREAAFTDPQQRLLLETAWHALEDAGYGGRKAAGSDTGVYFAFSPTVRDMYSKLIFDVDPNSMSDALVGNATSVAAGRISYMLDLHGPSMVLDTACSSALVALDTACQAIRTGRCGMALVGGIKLITVPAVFNGQIMGVGMESADGLTRTFDDNATGTAFGEGVEVILIKPLERALADGDHIHAVIKGTAVNQDGASAGITAPNPQAQVNVIQRAWDDAGIDPETVTYIEAHGSGTPLGDPIEISSIQAAFRKYTGKQHFCGVGAVKTHLGHLSEGAGMVGLIKSVLAMQHHEIPGNLHFNRPSRQIELIDSPVYVNTRRRKWDVGQSLLRCGVSAFGMSGTNGHVILEEYRQPAEAVPEVNVQQIFTLSARTPAVLSRLLANYREFLGRGGNLRLSDVCYTASTGRGHYACRLALIVDSMDELTARIEHLSDQILSGREVAGICYGEHKIVPEEKMFKEPGELTGKERYQLTAAALALVEPCEAGEPATREMLMELGALYVRGAEPDWEQLYADQKHHKVRLPVYPFESSRCWIEVPARTQAQAGEGLGTPYCTITWQTRPVLGTPKRRTGTAVLFESGPSHLAEAIAVGLRSRGLAVVQVCIGQGYAQIDTDLFTIAEVEADYARLFGELADRNVTLILHANMLAQGIAVSTLTELEEHLRGSVYSAWHLTRALVSSDITNAVDMYVVAPYVHDVTGREEQISAENGALCGLVKAIGLEHPHINVRAIDTDAATTAEQVLSELYTESNVFVSAYRDGVRYVEQLTDVSIDAIPQRDVSIKQGGTYVITGGLGGIGSMLAKHLASRYAAKLVLVNRLPMPDRREWAALLAAGNDSKLARRIATIKELEAAGSEVACYAADVSRPDELGPVLADVRSRFGRINGVIHAAGVANPGILLRKTEVSFNEVLDPKVRGTWLLDHLTEDDELDFFVLFSSGVTVVGEAGQSDYVAANYYLDSYAASRNRRRKCTLAIDWVSWAEAGMSVAFGIDVDGLFKVLSPDRAIDAFEQLLARDISRVLVGEFNADDPNELLAIDAFPCELSDKIRALVNNARSRTQGGVASPNRADAFIPLSTKRKMTRTGAAERVTLSGSETSEYGVIEEKIAQIYSDTLGFSNINIHDSFFELGGDSIMLSRMHVQLDKAFPGRIKLVELFEHTSVFKLAQHMKGKTEPIKPVAKPEDDQQVEAELRNLIDLMQSGKVSLEEALDSLKRDDK